MANNKLKIKLVGIILGLFSFFFTLFFVDLQPGKPEVTYTLAVALLMAIWWITEVVPLAVTALLPVVLFPLLGVMNGQAVSATYFNYVIFLFIGGFMVALAMQKWNLHKRIALKLLMLTGTSPARILLGFMFVTAFLSMWISNTATAMMVVPIVMSIIIKLEEHLNEKDLSRYSVGLLLGVAYSASIGGIATLVGTPPNLSFARIFQIMFPEAPQISFSDWFIFAVPITIILFILVWLYLYFLYKPKTSLKSLKAIDFKLQYKALGPMSFAEKVILADFIVLAILWLSRSEIAIGSFYFPGWGSLFGNPEYLNDGTVAIAMAVILFIIPAGKKDNEPIITWETMKKIPWDIVLLFGGGFALASAFKESGLSLWFGELLGNAASLHPFVLIFIIAIAMTFLTELTSNTATTEMILPILAGISVAAQINPLLLMLPATISASLAFMLPVATPPNAIVFASSKLQVMQMAKAGLLINILGAILVTLMTYYWGSWIFNIDFSSVPFWVK
ncbi:MAG TPA: SLC13 family permease [Bacteroidales bacterium]